MPNDDPFADLGQTLENQSDDDHQEDTETTENADPRAEGSDLSIDNQLNPITDAAFSYEAANQRPFYAREETINDFDSWLNYELERELNNRGYQNIVVREMTDALLRTVVENDMVDEVAERFEEAREDSTGK
jgi:hypothetical protein